MTNRHATLAATMAMALSVSAQAQSPLTAYQTLGRDVLRELVETNTTYTDGSTTKAAEALAESGASAS